VNGVRRTVGIILLGGGRFSVRWLMRQNGFDQGKLKAVVRSVKPGSVHQVVVLRSFIDL